MKGMSARAIAIAGVCVLIAAGPAAAEELLMAAGNIRACFVDLQEVLQNFPEYGKAKESLEEWAKPKQKLITEKERELSKLEKELKKNLLISEEAKKEKEGEFKKKVEEYQELGKQLQSDLAGKEEELLAPVKETLSKVIEGVTKARGFNLVFDATATPGGRPILYVDDTLDVTADVIEKVKERAGKKDKPEEKK